jgi:ribosomal protein L31
MPTGNLITFCVWNYGITAQQSSVIECRDVNGARTINVHLPWSDGNIYFDCGGDRLYQAAGSTYLGLNYWCFTKNASTGNMVIYRNGTSWASSVGNVGTINTTTASRLCSYAIDTTYHNAYLSNVKIYSRELSATQVKQNFNAQKSRFGL